MKRRSSVAQPETRFKIKVQAELKKFPNLWFVKIQMVATRGIPDILICYKGLFIAAELKVGKNKLTELQQFTLDKITNAGGKSWTVTPTNLKDFLDYLKSL
jgi:hypothetical protein